jgi:hypothetical protein
MEGVCSAQVQAQNKHNAPDQNSYVDAFGAVLAPVARDWIDKELIENINLMQPAFF